MDDKSQNPNHAAHFVRTDEPAAKAPPALETGALKWMRDNLFSSGMNTMLTFVGLAIVIYSLYAMIRWSIQDANWHAIFLNLRLLMIGRFEPQYEWRITAIMLVSSFALGAAIAVWIKKIARVMLFATIVIGIMTIFLPRAVMGNVPLPIAYMAAGNVPVVLGTSSEMPIESIAFIALEGESVTITLADHFTSEEALANMAGFIDRASNTLRNGAGNRLDAIEVQNTLMTSLETDAALEIPRITASQLELYNTQLAAYVETAPMIETYHLNQNPVRVTITNAETMEVVQTLDVGADNVFAVTLRETGWYILKKEYLPSEAVPEGISILSVRGVYPLLQSSSFNPAAGGFVDDFVRVIDAERLSDPLPQIDGSNARFVNIIENKYFGARSFTDYLSAYLAPFLKLIGIPLTSYFLLGILGYWFTVAIGKGMGKQKASNFAAVSLVSLPILFWLLVNGMYAYTVLMWLLVLSMAFACILVYQLMRRFGIVNPIGLFSLALISVFYLGILFSTQTNPEELDLFTYLRVYTLLIEPAGLPRFILWLNIIFLLMAAYSGYRAYAETAANKNKGNPSKISMFYGLGFLLLCVVASYFLFGQQHVSFTIPTIFWGAYQVDFSLPIRPTTEWLLQPSQSNDWGGLLLVMAITIYGIIIAFPIGVGLALGRRSELPIIRNLCIGYIELVRGVPFITVLFFVQLLLPLLNPELAELSNTYRAIIATIVFSAAYLAENVRGGLQALPNGQSEAAKALGLSAWQMTMLITMPQALRAVIPALVGQFISLFKDTSLVAIVGLSDLVKIVDTINANTAFSGTKLEGLVFISVIYFVFSYVMGYVSRLLEASGSGVTRRM